MCVCIQTAKSFLRCQTWLPRFWGYRQRFGLSSRGWGCWLPWQWYSCPSFVDTVETMFNARGRILFCTVGATEVTFTSLPKIQSPYQTCKLSGKGHLESSWPGKTWLATGGVQNVAVFFCFQYASPLQVVVLACASVVFYFPRQRPSRSEVAAFQAEVVDLIRSYYPSIWEAHHLIQGTQLVFHRIWHLFGYVWILICSTLFLPQKLPRSTAWGSVGSRLERWRS